MATLSIKKLQSQEEIAKFNAEYEAAQDALKDAESAITSEVEAVVYKVYQRPSGWWMARTRCPEGKVREAVIGDTDKGYKEGQRVIVGIKHDPKYKTNFNIRGLLKE